MKNSLKDLQKYKYDRMVRDRNKYKNLYNEYYDECLALKELLNKMAEENAELQKEIIINKMQSSQ